MRGLAAIVCVLGLALPAQAQAQECAGGRVATAQGQCCWPGQRSDELDHRCEGPPTCPAPLVAAGTECVAAEEGVEAAPAQPDVRAEGVIDYRSGVAPRAQAPAGPVGGAWPSAGQRPPAGARDVRRTTRSDEGLQAAGITLLSLGYAGTVLGSVVALSASGLYTGNTGSSFDRTCHESTASTFLVPGLGGLLALVVIEACQVPTYSRVPGALFRTGSASMELHAGWGFLGTLSALFQLGGLALLVAGSLSRGELTVWEADGLSLGVGPMRMADVGIEGALRF